MFIKNIIKKTTENINSLVWSSPPTKPIEINLTIEINNESSLNFSKTLKQLIIKYKILNVKFDINNTQELYNFDVSDTYLKDIWFYDIYIKNKLKNIGNIIKKGFFYINLSSKLITINI
jgi:hypothetical protein